MECFYDRLPLNSQTTIDFHGIRFEADKPRMKAELIVMMAEV